MYDKDDVLTKAYGMWPEILQSLAGLDSRYLNHNKHCDCPLGCIGGSSNSQPGGKDRFRWMNKPDGHSICNVCGSRDGLNLYIDLTGHDFSTAIKDIGDYVNCIPVEQREIIQREQRFAQSFPKWYKFDMKHYLKLKEKAENLGPSPFEKVDHKSVFSAFDDGIGAMIPLRDTNGVVCDLVMLNQDGSWETSAGNTIIPPGFFSLIGGHREGKAIYICSNPLMSVIASQYMQSHIYCTYDEDNFLPMLSYRDKHHPDKGVIAVCCGMDDVESADLEGICQMIMNPSSGKVIPKIYKPGEYINLRKNK
jgi:phage/plasmid primase-like uncharacterized protein